MPHGHCFLWRPDILWLNVGSDIVIALSYFSISFSLSYFFYKRKDLAFNWIFVMFAMFIVACGSTHLIEIMTIWDPIYGIHGVVKFFTAAISIATAIALWPLMPKAIKLPSSSQLEQKNRELQALNLQLSESSESRLHQVFEAAPNGLLMVDQSGKIVLCNAEIEALFGYSRKEILGKQIEVLIPENFRRNHPDLRQGYFMNPETRQMGAGRDLTGLREDGNEFPVEIGLNPVRTNDGLCVLASIVDITERKAIEQKLHEAITARDDFMSIASHELKTPLTSLSLQIQMAKQKLVPAGHETLSPDKLGKIFEAAGKQVDRLKGLIEDLMDISRIQTGKFSFNFEVVNLSTVVKEMTARMSEAFTKAKMPYSTEIEENIIGHFDHLRIEQVIDNLLTNALKYAPENPIKVSLKKYKDRVRLVVEDHGQGIPVEKQTKIFDRFERATLSRNVTGLGLGLFIARQIVQGHHGSIHVESSIGKGSKFIVDLPLDDQSSAAINKETINGES